MDRYLAISFCALAISVMAFMMYREDKLPLFALVVVILASAVVAGFMMFTLQ